MLNKANFIFKMNGLVDQFQIWVEVGLREIFVIEGPTVGSLSSVKTFKSF